MALNNLGLGFDIFAKDTASQIFAKIDAIMGSTEGQAKTTGDAIAKELDQFLGARTAQKDVEALSAALRTLGSAQQTLKGPKIDLTPLQQYEKAAHEAAAAVVEAQQK